MANIRDNKYYEDRLRKDGFMDLLEKIHNGEMTVYEAAISVGYRKRPGKISPEKSLQHHWERASRDQRIRFIGENYHAVFALFAEMKTNFDAAKKRRDNHE